jgi:hypothetical protein
MLPKEPGDDSDASYSKFLSHRFGVGTTVLIFFSLPSRFSWIEKILSSISILFLSWIITSCLLLFFFKRILSVVAVVIWFLISIDYHVLSTSCEKPKINMIGDTLRKIIHSMRQNSVLKYVTPLLISIFLTLLIPITPLHEIEDNFAWVGIP